MKYKILPALLLFCTLFSLAALEITRNGAPCARIAVAKDAPYVEQFAAKDLQHWIREISGAELPIVNEAGKEGGTTIFIGIRLGQGDPWQQGGYGRAHNAFG